jgi:hypothetical protein
MKFIQHNNGSCDIVFSWKERITLFRKGKLHLSDEHLRHFGNNLVRIVSDWNMNFNDKLKKIQTTVDSKIEGK